LLFTAGFALVLPALEPIADGLALPGILFPVTATDEHHGLYDSDAMLREPINAANAYAGLDGIPFSSTARLTLVGVLPKTCLIGHCRTSTNLEEAPFDCY
jgi:hypothetical protein